MKTVQILGLAPNLMDTPMTDGVERWCAGVPRSYRIKGPKAILTAYTRWFNVHTIKHIKTRYPSGFEWYSHQTKPIYLQEATPEVPASITFPREQIQQHFSINGQPNRFFTCSAAWLIAFAIMEGFERIELWGFQLRREHQYDWERPCFFYWIERAKQAGIEVILPPDLVITEPGSPDGYDGPLYGYEPHNEYYAASF
jgi:hypothetical protein